MWIERARFCGYRPVEGNLCDLSGSRLGSKIDGMALSKQRALTPLQRFGHIKYKD
jgi:hypothetical protein